MNLLFFRLSFFTLLFFLFNFTFAQENAKETGCSLILKSLAGKNKTLTAMVSSTESLLQSKAEITVPISVLFQVDLTNDEAIVNRSKELSSLLTREQILAQPEFKAFATCASDLESLSLLDQVISKQIELNNKKLQLFKLDKDKRLSITSLSDVSKKHSEAQDKIQDQLSFSRANIEKAQSKLTETESEITEKQDPTKEQLAISRAQLEKFIIDIESEHVQYIEAIQSRKEILDMLRSRFSLIGPIENLLTPDQINTGFETVNEIWSNTSSELLNLFSVTKIANEFTIPDLLEKPALITEEDKKVYHHYIKTYLKAKNRHQQLLRLKTSLLSELKAQNFRLLSDSGSARATLISLCNEMNACPSIQGLTEKYVKSFIREIRILPLKFLAGGINKWVELQTKFKAGFDSWIDLARQLATLIFLILLPFLAHRILYWLSIKLDSLRSSILTKSVIDYRRRTRVAMWISRLNPFVPSVGMIASLHLGRILIETTDLKELSYLLFYLELYFIYRATRLFLKIALDYIFSTESLENQREKEEKAERTARRLSRLFFIQFAILHLIEDTVRKALVYDATTNVVMAISIFLFLFEMRNWRPEITNEFKSRFPNVWSKIHSLTSSRFANLLLPFMFLMSLGHILTHMLSGQLIRFDFFKRILSDIFRRKLERDENFSIEKITPHAEYLSAFDYYLPAKKEVYIEREPTVADGTIQTINNWVKGNSNDDLVILVGNRGIGKTTTLRTIYERINWDVKSFHWVPAKTVTAESFYSWLSNVFKIEIKSVEDLKRLDSNLGQKTVVMVDDIHNLFLGRIGGFEAYRLFSEVLSLRTKNIFWCLTVNSHAWTYLQGVFSKNHFYGKTFKLRMWSDSEIQQLILNRHEKTGYSRTFDKSITAYGTGDVLGEKIETQFFRLLWGQSRGNPRSALMHWISAISQPAEKQIHVGIPKFIESAVAGSVSTEALILLAAIARHDSMTHDELVEITGINKTIVRKCMKESHDKELVWSDDERRIRISSRAQSAIDYYLMGKNFLYE